MSRTLHATTPFPNLLLDEAMPRLKDTEWRVLCVIVRQTLGWQVDERTKQRKEADWLTHSQLKRRTGRASEALSKAVDVLVRDGWIEVCDVQERPLTTAVLRRNCRGPVFFRLGQRTQDYLFEKGGTTTSDPTSVHKDINSQSEVLAVQSEVFEPQSENRKAKITKEAHTKIIPYGREDHDTVIHRQPVDNPLLQENGSNKKKGLR